MLTEQLHPFKCAFNVIMQDSAIQKCVCKGSQVPSEICSTNLGLNSHFDIKFDIDFVQQEQLKWHTECQPSIAAVKHMLMVDSDSSAT